MSKVGPAGGSLAGGESGSGGGCIPHAAHLTWVVPLAGGGVVCGRAPSKGSSVLRVIQKRAKTTPRTP